MAIGVDTSKWKPRRLKGTPALKFGNIIGCGIITFGILWGAFYQFSSRTEKIRNKFEPLYEDPVSEIERRFMIASGLPNRSGDVIRKLIENEERPDLPYK